MSGNGPVDIPLTPEVQAALDAEIARQDAITGTFETNLEKHFGGSEEAFDKALDEDPLAALDKLLDGI